MDINNLTWVQQYGLKSEQYSLTKLLTSMKCPPIFSQHTFLNKINNYTVTQSFLWSILLCIHSAMYILNYFFFYICKSCISLVCKNILLRVLLSSEYVLCDPYRFVYSINFLPPIHFWRKNNRIKFVRIDHNVSLS